MSDLVLTAESGIAAARDGSRPTAAAAMRLVEVNDLGSLTAAAAQLRDRGHGRLLSYSRKVFIPLTHLCRDVCHYCTFARPPKKGERAYVTRAEVLAGARAGDRQRPRLNSSHQCA